MKLRLKNFLLFTTFLEILICTISFSYILSVGDVVSVSIFTSEGKVYKDSFAVDIDGYASVPYVGRRKVEGMSLKELEKAIKEYASTFLPSAVVVVSLEKPRPQYVFFQGLINNNVDISTIPVEERRLSYIIGRVPTSNLPYNLSDYFSNLKIIRGSSIIKVDLKKFYDTGDFKFNPILKENDIVYIPVPESVAVVGYADKPGVYSVPLNTSVLEVLSMAGVRLDNNVVKSIIIYRNDSVIKISYPQEKKKLLLKVHDGDIIEIQPYSQLNVYIIGEVSKRATLSERDHPTLRKLIANINLPFINDIKREIIFIRGDVRERYVVSDPMKLPDKELRDGDIIGIYVAKPVMVYVTSDEPIVKSGLVRFEYYETPSLRTLIFKLGLGNRDTGIFVSNASDTEYVTTKDVIERNKDIILSNYDYVYITSKPFGEVHLVGFSKNKIGLLEPRESVAEILKRCPPSVEYSQIDSFVIMKKDKRQEIPAGNSDLLNKVMLEDGDGVYVKLKQEKYVYVIGDVNTTLVFSTGEEISREAVISKLGVKPARIESIDGSFENGGVVSIKLRKDIRVFLLGDSIKNGEINLKWDEPHKLITALSKAGGINYPIIDPNLKLEKLSFNVKVYRKNKVIMDKDISSSKVSQLDQDLEDGDVVYVYVNKIEVKVFGGQKQGTFLLPKGITFDKFLGIIGGFSENMTSVKVFRQDGSVKVFDVSLDHIPNFVLKDDDTLIFSSKAESFVYVMGDVGNPGAVYTGGFKLSLIKVLSVAGGLKSWENKRKLRILRSDGKEEVYNLNYEELKDVVVGNGDIVYVEPSSSNRVYVLGAVNRPSVVYIDVKSTLLDAIVKAGGFRKGADLSKVYVFKGGVNGSIEVYDMRWVPNGKTGRNPLLNPGDIIYVPDSPYMTISEIMSFVQSTITFINNSIELYKNVNYIVGGQKK